MGPEVASCDLAPETSSVFGESFFNDLIHNGVEMGRTKESGLAGKTSQYFRIDLFFGCDEVVVGHFDKKKKRGFLPL